MLVAGYLRMHLFKIELLSGSLFVFVFNFFPFLVNVAVGATPLFAIGIIAQKVEDDVFTKDKSYPAFIRSLGSAVEIKGGAAISALKALQVHDFGPLNKLSVDIYRRLQTGNNKYRSWKYFCADSGSNLIYQFTQIFSESVFLGGAPERIGEIISNNFQKLLALRKQKIQLVSGLRGSFYGSLVGFAAAGYISAQIASMLAGLFSTPFSALDGGGNLAGDVLGGIVNTGALAVNMETISIYIGIMIIIHSIVSAVILKIADGGTFYAAFFDIVIMIWMGAIISWILPHAVQYLLPGMTDMLSNTAGVAAGVA